MIVNRILEVGLSLINIRSVRVFFVFLNRFCCPFPGSLHRGMLNAYGRVDKGRLHPLNRGDDRDSAFGTHIGATYERFRNVQRTANGSDSINCNTDQSKCKKNTDLNVKNVDATHGSRKRNKRSDKGITDDSVYVSDTLLSNLLINSVLSALRSGVRSPDLIYYLLLHFEELLAKNLCLPER